MLEGARKEFQKLMMMEDAMLIHRIMRAPEKRIFKIDIGNIPPNEVDSFMEQIINKMKKVPHIDPQTGNYNLRFNLNNMLEDYYLPVRGGNSTTSIDTLPGMTFTGLDDIEYVKNKMMAALKIPKPFLGYSEAVEGKTTLASMDIRFARTIERVQKIVVSELTKIAIVHLYAQGFEGEDLIGFDLELTAPSIVYDQQKVALMTEKMTLATAMRDSKLVSDKFIYEFIFNMSEDQWLQQRTDVVEDLKLRFRQNQIEQEGNDPAIIASSIIERIGKSPDWLNLATRNYVQANPGKEPQIEDIINNEIKIYMTRRGNEYAGTPTRIPRATGGSGDGTPDWLNNPNPVTLNIPYASGKASVNGQNYIALSLPNKNFAGSNAIDLTTGSPVKSLKSSNDYQVVGIANFPTIASGKLAGSLAQPNYESKNQNNISYQPYIHVQQAVKVGSRTINKDLLVPFDRLPENVKSSKTLQKIIGNFRPSRGNPTPKPGSGRQEIPGWK